MDIIIINIMWAEVTFQSFYVSFIFKELYK